MKILLVAPSLSSFVETDYEILRNAFETDLQISWTLTDILKAINKVFKSDLIIFWFASLRFFPIFIMAKILRKKIITIAGGYDVSYLPNINYGGMAPLCYKSKIRKFIFENSNKVITVSNSNTKEAIENANISPKLIKMIYLGFNKPNCKITPWNERKNQIVFIASCDHISYKIKGFDHFLKLALDFPNYNFVHIGKIEVNDFREKCRNLKNVTTLGYIENNSLKFSTILSESKVLLAPSEIESFGAAVVEGAIHGCFPVVTNKYSLPEIANQFSKIVSNLNELGEAIDEVIKSNSINPIEIHTWYHTKFDLKLRATNLIRTITHL